MAVKIRLLRVGRSGYACYRIVAADARSPRDGKFIEKLGHYNPNLPKGSEKRACANLEAVIRWIDRGAQMTDTVKRIFWDIWGADGILKEKYVSFNPKKATVKPKKTPRKSAQKNAQEVPASDQLASA